MKKTLSLLLALFLFPVFIAFADEGGFVIRDYSFYGTLHENNTMSVTEEIKVHFFEKRHGIYRAIPHHIKITDEYGDTRTYLIKVKDVSVKDEKFKVKKEDGNYNIRIGNSFKEISGDKTYSISYTLSTPDDRISDYDLFMYSVLGPQWDVPINSFEFNINMEKAFPSDTEISVFSGVEGSEDNSLSVLFDADGTYIHGAVSNVPPRNAITVHALLPQGYFVGTRKPLSIIPWIFNLATIVVSLILIVTALLKTHPTVVQSVQKTPLEGISSAEVGYIIDCSVDDSDMIALIPEWCMKGYLNISQRKNKSEEDVLCLTKKVEKLPESEPEYQRDFFKAIFGKKHEVMMDKLPKSFEDKLEDCKDKLSDVYKDDRALFTYDRAFEYFILCLLYYLGRGTASAISLVENLYLLIGPIALFYAYIRVDAERGKRGFGTAGGIVVTVLTVIFTLGINIGSTYLWVADIDSAIPHYVLYASLASVVAAIAVSPRGVARTEYGAELAGKILGLREYIKTVDIPSIEVLQEENPGYYFELLPYAMVFGLEDVWSEKFMNIGIENPEWCRMGDGVFLPDVFSEFITRTLTDGLYNAQSHSSSSRGSSGGGSGGGGGGSW